MNDSEAYICHQKVQLFGKPELVTKVFDEAIRSTSPEVEVEGSESNIFTNTVVETKEPDILSIISVGPFDLGRLSKEFPKVGFYYELEVETPINEYGITEVGYYLEGHILYSVFMKEHASQFWQRITGSRMKDRAKFNKRWNLKP